MKSLVFLLFAVIVSTAVADTGAEARAHFQRGNAHFALGEFAQAAEAYQEAYRLKQDPALLYNAAQAYRLAGNPQRALILYKNYVQFFPSEANIEDIRAQIARLKDVVIAAEKAASGPPTGTAEPGAALRNNPDSRKAPLAEVPVMTVEGQRTRTADAAMPEAQRKGSAAKPLYKSWWLWSIVATVAAGGIIAGAVLGSRAEPWANGPEFGPGSAQGLRSWQ